MRLNEQMWVARTEQHPRDHSMPHDIRGTEGLVARAVFASEARLIAAAPDMARAHLRVVNDVMAAHMPVVGPSATVDDVVARGQPVIITAEAFAGMVAALRKAGVL